MEMAKEEKAAVGANSALKPAATEVEADDMPGNSVARDSIPTATICGLVPGGCLFVAVTKISIVVIVTVKNRGSSNRKRALELEQSRALVDMASWPRRRRRRW